MAGNVKSKKYDRVMPRVNTLSRSSFKSASFVTRHGTLSSVRLGGKPSVSSVNSDVISDLPTVLNDYKREPMPEKTVKRTFVVKPRKTLKSLDPGLSPPRSVRRSQELTQKPASLRVRGSAPSVLAHGDDKWTNSHLKRCHSSRSHGQLKELKDEIQAYQEREKLMRLRSHLYKSCGVVLDDVGQVAADKAVQVEPEAKEKSVKTKWKNMRTYFFKELKKMKTPDGNGQIVNTTWPLFNQLMFLKDNITVVERESNAPTTSDDSETNYHENDHQVDEHNDNDSSSQYLFPISSESPHIQAPPRKMFKFSSDYFQLRNEQLLQEKQRELQQKETEREQEADLYFFQSLLPYLKEIPLKNKLRLRSKIQELILQEIEAAESEPLNGFFTQSMKCPNVHLNEEPQE